MRILIINDHGISGGGTENRIRLLIQELLDKKIAEEIHVLARYGTETPLTGVIFHKLEQQSPFLETIKIIRRHHINIVQIHSIVSITPTPILAAKLLRKPIIFFAHDYWPVCGRRSYIPAETASHHTLCEQTNFKKCVNCIGVRTTLKLKIWKKIMNFCTIGISAGQFLIKQYEKEGVLNNNWHIIPPWIDLSTFTPPQNYNPQENLILFVGSLIEFKGAWVLARALKHVIKEIPTARILFIGNEQETHPYRQKIEKILKEDKTLEHVVFLGQQNWQTIRAWHAQSKVLVFPSVCTETFGLAWAEAMASGVPIIASAVGSVPEFVANKGIFVPPRDEQALAQSIINIIENPEQAIRMSETGKKYAAQQFNLTNAVEELNKVYNKFL